MIEIKEVLWLAGHSLREATRLAGLDRKTVRYADIGITDRFRSTPRLAATSLCGRPAYQWTKISVTSVTSNVLLANLTPGHLS